MSEFQSIRYEYVKNNVYFDILNHNGTHETLGARQCDTCASRPSVISDVIPIHPHRFTRKHSEAESPGGRSSTGWHCRRRLHCRMRGDVGCHWRSLWAASVDGNTGVSSRSTPHRATFVKMPGQVVSAWVTLNGSSSSDITNSGVRDPNAAGSTALTTGDYLLMSFTTPGWTWTNTGSQTSTLNETVGQTVQSMPDMMTGAAVAITSETALVQTTSATELGHSATVLRTSTGSSTLGNI